jgi:hypothetical protein
MLLLNDKWTKKLKPFFDEKTKVKQRILAFNSFCGPFCANLGAVDNLTLVESAEKHEIIFFLRTYDAIVMSVFLAGLEYRRLKLEGVRRKQGLIQ